MVSVQPIFSIFEVILLVVIRVGFYQTSHRNSVVNHHCYGKKTEVNMSVQAKKN